MPYPDRFVDFGAVLLGDVKVDDATDETLLYNGVKWVPVAGPESNVIADDSTNNASALLAAAAADRLGGVRIPPGIARTLSQVKDAVLIGPGQIREGSTDNDLRAPYHVRVTTKSAKAVHSGFDRFSGDIRGPFHVSTFLMDDEENVAPGEGGAYTLWPEYAPFHAYMYIDPGVGGNENLDQGGPERTGIYQFRGVITHRGLGDAVVYNGVVNVSGTQGGQTHFLGGSAGALLNGDVNAAANGVYLQASEVHMADKTFDVAAVGHTLSMFRENTTGAMSALWQGFRVQSKLEWINHAFVAAGDMRVAFDAVTADLLDAAVAVGPDHRISLAATAELDPLYGGTTRWGADDNFDAAYLVYSSSLARTVLGIAGVNVFQVDNDHVRVQTGADAQRGVRVYGAGANSTLFASIGQAANFAYISAVSEASENNGLAFVVSNAGVESTPLSIASSGNATLQNNLRVNGNVGFNNSAPVAKGTIAGSRADGTALANLLTYLASRGDITNSSTA